MKARVHRPAARREGAPTLAYLHGGGWVLLDLDTHDRLMRELAQAGGCDVVGLDYPLAPETRFPGAIDACVAALRALPGALPGLGAARPRRRLGRRQHRRGGGAIALREAGAGDGLAGLLLAYGVYDCDLSRASYDRPSVSRPICSRPPRWRGSGGITAQATARNRARRPCAPTSTACRRRTW